MKEKIFFAYFVQGKNEGWVKKLNETFLESSSLKQAGWKWVWLSENGAEWKWSQVKMGPSDNGAEWKWGWMKMGTCKPGVKVADYWEFSMQLKERGQGKSEDVTSNHVWRISTQLITNCRKYIRALPTYWTRFTFQKMWNEDVALI